MSNEIQNMVYHIERVENLVTIRFLSGDHFGEYVQDLDYNGVDIKSVVELNSEPGTDHYIYKRSTLYPIRGLKHSSELREKLPEIYCRYSNRQIVNTLEDMLKW